MAVDKKTSAANGAPERNAAGSMPANQWRSIKDPALVSALLLALALLLVGVTPVVAQTIRINEIQASNGSTLTDDTTGTPDWLELYNTSTNTVDLHGWGLSDDLSTPFKWVFTNAILGPGELLLIYASGLNRQPGTASPLAPTNVPGLRVWLRADAVSTNDPTQARPVSDNFFVRRWLDQSGNAFHAQQDADARQPQWLPSVPAFNHRPALRFDGVDDFLVLPAVPAANNFCIVAVARPNTSHQIDPQSATGVDGVTGQRYLLGAAHGGDYSAGAGLSLGTNGASIYEHGSGYMPALAVGGQVGTGAAVVIMNYSNRQPTLWIQGNLAARGFFSARTNVTAPVEIGAGAYGAFSGEVAEILYYNRALTDDELLGLQQHFAREYGLVFPRHYHTSFKIDTDGEPLLLTRPNGAPEDFVPAIAIPRDVSYGRQPDGSDSFFFFDQPTPGRPNLTPGATDLLSPPQFSVPAGFYTQAITVAIVNTNTGAQIRYTLDGSEPTTNSPLYTSPLTFTTRAGTPNDLSLIPTAGGWQPPLGEVYKIHVLRARAFRTNALPSPTTTATYAVDPLGRARYPLPVVSLVTDRKHFFDPNTGIYVCGNTPGCNYAQGGDAWERPVHVEFFETNGLRVIAQESGVRMHGNTSFGFPIKALRLHPLNQKGTGPFRYQIFPDLPIYEFHRLLLRPSGHDHYLTMMRDGLMQNLVRELGLDLQGYRPAVVFLNGEFWGLHNLQEAYEKNYFAHHHPGVDPEAIDYLEGYSPGAFTYEGDSAWFDQLILFLQTHDLRQATNFAVVQSFMEVDNYRDYKIVETFYYRWDIGNQRVWRPRTPDGRLRWILFDCDVGFGGFWSQPPEAPWTFNMLAYNLETNGPWTHYRPGNDHNAPSITFQLRALMTNPDFKRDFINRCADLMNTTLATARLTNFITRMAAEIAPVMAEHCARWRFPADYTTWSNNVEFLKQFAIQRPEYMRRHLTNQFGLRGWVNVSLSVNDTNAGVIRLNTLRLAAPPSAPWSGIYFRDNPVTFTAEPRPGYRFKNWQGFFGPLATNQSNTILLTGNLNVMANFEVAPSTNPPVPLPHDLTRGPYVFTRWDASAPAGTYPPNMIFLQTATNASPDPGLLTEFTNLWVLPYDRTSRSRISGLSEEGLAFLNTSDPQADGGGYLGAAVLALKTTGLTNVYIVWRGGTVTPNSRHYALRLQYRLGQTEAWTDLLDLAGQPVEYPRHATAGHSALLGPVPLPASACNQPYVQLRWKYYWQTGDSGPRDQLRLDDITIYEAPTGPPPRLERLQLTGGPTLSVGFYSLPQATFSLLASSNLTHWTLLQMITANANGRLEFNLPLTERQPAGYYRLRSP